MYDDLEFQGEFIETIKSVIYINGIFMNSFIPINFVEIFLSLFLSKFLKFRL